MRWTLLRDDSQIQYGISLRFLAHTLIIARGAAAGRRRRRGPVIASRACVAAPRSPPIAGSTAPRLMSLVKMAATPMLRGQGARVHGAGEIRRQQMAGTRALGRDLLQRGRPVTTQFYTATVMSTRRRTAKLSALHAATTGPSSRRDQQPVLAGHWPDGEQQTASLSLSRRQQQRL